MTRKPNFWKCILGVTVLAFLFIGTMAITRAPRTRATNLAPAVASNVTVANSTTVPINPVVDVTDAFELDGNIKDDPASTTKEDWERLNCEDPYTGSATARTGVVPDPAPLSIYTGGGSKDTYDINHTSASGVVAATDTSWLHTNGSVPDKNDITNAYAASYNVDPDGAGGDPPQTLLYVGGDRFSNDGDAFIGAWFFQNAVFNASAGPDEIPGNLDDVPFPDGTFRSAASATAPLARHAFGDILVLANFPGGVAASDAKVFKWVQTPGLDGTSGNGDDVKCTDQWTGNPGGNCPVTLFDRRGKPITRCASDTLCEITPAPGVVKTAIGFTNPAALSETAEGVCWDYTSKVETNADEIPTNSFFEVGINLSALGLGGECFPSFALETRSSESVTAQLKDFVLHAFQSCGSSCDKTPETQTVCEDPLTPGFAEVTQTFEANNTGTLPIQVTLKDHQVLPDGTTLDTFITGVDGDGKCTFGDETNVPIAGLSTFTCDRTAASPVGTTTDTLTVHTVVPASGIEDCEQTATVIVNPNPDAAADQPAAQCLAVSGATSFSLNGTATNGTPHWSVQSVSGGNIALADVSFSPNADVEDPTANIAAGKFGTAVVRLTVSNSTTNCPSDFVDINLVVNPNPDAAAAQPAAVCAAASGPTSFSLDGTATNGTPLWSVVSFTGGALTDVTFDNAAAADTTANIAAGTYGRAVVRLTVSNATTGCPSDFVDINLDVDPNPTVEICSTDSDKECTDDESLTLTASVSPAGGTVSYTWQVPTGVTCGDSADCTATRPGTYRVTVTRTDLTTAGCSGTTSTHVGLCADCVNTP